MSEVMINKILQEKLNALIQETVMEKKSEEDPHFFHDDNASQK